MSIQLTDAALEAAKTVGKNPNLVLEIEGIDQLFGAVPIRKYVMVGDDFLIVEDPLLDVDGFYVGGYNLIKEQESIILLEGTTTSIKQSLNVDKGEGASVSNMAVALIDDGTLTEIITPTVSYDILQRKCRLWLGFEQTAYPNDYFIVFRGLVTDVQSTPGKVVFQINSPDDKKRSTVYKSVETKLTNSIDAVTTSITLDSTANILTPIFGPDGNIDPAFECYIKIGDDDSNEIVRFTGISGNDLTGVTRAGIATLATSHTAGDAVTTFYRLIDDAMILALKFMFSGLVGDFVSDINVQSFNIIPDGSVANAIYFNNVNIADVYGLSVGDYITTTGATNGANNVTLKPILEIVESSFGSYIIVDGVSFIDEDDSNALLSVRSQYDTLPDGLKMGGDEVDVERHLYLYRTFLSSDQYDIYIKETIDNAKEYLEKTIYSPIGCYSIPRKSKASVGYHIGPIPGQDIPTLNSDSVKNASRQKLRRSTNNNFYNEIIYKFEEDRKTDRFLSNLITISATSKNRIPGANKTLIIEAKGFRDGMGGEARAQLHSNRRLRRYEFGAETLSAQVLFEKGFNLEIGDIVLYDGSDLKMSDTKSGEIGIAPRLYEVQNKDFNFRTGDISLEMVDTAYSTDAAYCLIGHSSNIQSGISTTQFVIEESYGSTYGSSEYRKWQNLALCSVVVRSADFATYADTVIQSATSNVITVSPALPFTPTTGMILELSPYDDSDVTDQVKAVYGHMSPLNGGADDPYTML